MLEEVMVERIRVNEKFLAYWMPEIARTEGIPQYKAHAGVHE